MGSVAEIAPGIYRVTVFVPEFNLEFNHFLVNDDEPLLFHTGFRRTFAEVREGIASIIDPARIRWIGFSHFESDECGALNEWLAIAPHAEPVCGLVGALVTVNDFSNRPAHILTETDVLATGRRRFRFQHTPHLPHGWDAGVLYEETGRTLFCSDLFLQTGKCEPVTRDDVIGRAREALAALEAGPFAGVTPYNARTGVMLNKLADLKPSLLVTQHGSAYAGDGEQALRALDVVYREALGKPAAAGSAR
ncbi:MAG: MBL fold metallo-hydrolase [Rhodospirillales bacterium]